MLGIEIPENFNRPYLAKNLREFWRRWHISLSTWLRDYLYISLGGNKKGRVRMYLAIFITMLLGGLWHGAAWTFVLWGWYHGVLLMINRWWQERRRSSPKVSEDGAGVKILKGVITFHLVCLGWLIFRSQSPGDAWAMIHNLFSAPLDFNGLPIRGVAALVIGYLMHFTPVRLRERLGESFTRSPIILQGAALAIMLALINLLKNVSAPFIYFQF